MMRPLFLQFLLIPFGLTPAIAQSVACEAPPTPLGYYEQASMISLIAGFSLLIVAIILDKKKIKLALAAVSLVPFLVWTYVNFFVDYDKIHKTIFNLNVRAESTLANIAEAQDRYKSEQGEFIKDLSQVKSHLAGAHGVDECVEILTLEVGFEHWTATAKHVSSPEIVKWDSTSGSSLRKG